MKISIVTVIFNDVNNIENTINSVISQNYNNFEYIIIDGASVDGSLEIIDKYNNSIDFIISEPDKGIYFAMNKALDCCNGDFIIFMNSGDSFFDNRVLSDIAPLLQYDKFFFGRCQIIDLHGRNWFYPDTLVDENYISRWLGWSYPNHQSCFFPKVFYKSNYFNVNYRISSDSDYKLRALKSLDYVFIDKLISTFALGGVSSVFNFRNINRIIDERISRFEYDNIIIRIFFIIYINFYHYLKFGLFYLLGSHANYFIYRIVRIKLRLLKFIF